MKRRNQSNRPPIHEIKVRYRDKDFTLLKELVDKTPYSREEFVRRATLGAKICENLPADYSGILRELRRIGSNVDQLLVKARSLNFIDQVSLQRVKEQINKMDEQFGRSFGDWERTKR